MASLDLVVVQLARIADNVYALGKAPWVRDWAAPLASIGAAFAAAISAWLASRSAGLIDAQRKAGIAPMVVLRSNFEAPGFRIPDDKQDQEAKVSLVNDGNGIALNVIATYDGSDGSHGAPEEADTIPVNGTHPIERDHEWWKAFQKHDGVNRAIAVTRVTIDYTDAEGCPYQSIRNEQRKWTRVVPEDGRKRH